jgi:hypothetical protein
LGAAHGIKCYLKIATSAVETRAPLLLGENAMRNRLRLSLMVITTVLPLASTSFGQGATDDEASAAAAKAMLAKAVAAVKADKVNALDMFNKGQSGFRDGDLYVFCVTTSDGKFVATGNPNSKQLLGVDVKTVKDSNGDPIKLDRATQKSEGEITTIDYNFAKPGTIDKPVPKETYITRVDDLTCGVGYYYFDEIEKSDDSLQ